MYSVHVIVCVLLFCQVQCTGITINLLCLVSEVSPNPNSMLSLYFVVDWFFSLGH